MYVVCVYIHVHICIYITHTHTCLSQTYIHAYQHAGHDDNRTRELQQYNRYFPDVDADIDQREDPLALVLINNYFFNGRLNFPAGKGREFIARAFVRELSVPFINSTRLRCLSRYGMPEMAVLFELPQSSRRLRSHLWRVLVG
jgi:hypothetical protein